MKICSKKRKTKDSRDAEIAKQLQEEFDRARQEQEVVAEADQAHNIDWSDLAEVNEEHGFGFQQSQIKKRSREDSDEVNAKKQKLEDDAEKKELRDM
ncbi:hypothetical protein Tco_0438889 [Tanacetum coccineum]